MVTSRVGLSLAVAVLVTAASTGCTGETDPSNADHRQAEPAPLGVIDDLKGQWRLLEAEIGGEQFALARGAGVELVVHTRSSQAFVGCDLVGLRPRVNGNDVSLRPAAKFGTMLSCSPFYKKSPLPSSLYFDALRAVDHGERDSRALILTGPDLVLTFRKHH